MATEEQVRMELTALRAAVEPILAAIRSTENNRRLMHEASPLVIAPPPRLPHEHLKVPVRLADCRALEAAFNGGAEVISLARAELEARQAEAARKTLSLLEKIRSDADLAIQELGAGTGSASIRGVGPPQE